MPANAFAQRLANPFGYPMGPYQGFQAFGNVDPLNRPTLHNPDGSYSTSSRATRYDPRDGTATIFPTVIGGRRLSEDDAWNHYLQTGEHMGKFRIAPPGQTKEPPNEAYIPSEGYSTGVHNWQASHYDNSGTRRYPVR